MPDHTFDFLAQDETLIVTYNVTVTDGTTSATRPIVITVQGSNDIPIVTATTLTGAVTEGANPPTESVSKTISFTDADLNDVYNVTAVLKGTDYTGGPLGTLTGVVTTGYNDY